MQTPTADVVPLASLADILQKRSRDRRATGTRRSGSPPAIRSVWGARATRVLATATAVANSNF